jgi:hypothetical protein
MIEFGQKRGFTCLVLAGLLCSTMAPSSLLGDEKEKSNPPAKASPAKSDAPAPGLTERERWLLDRVEQLEKRVAELEVKGNLPAAPASAALSSQPGSLTLSIPPAPTTAEGNSNVIPTEKVPASVTAQATEKGKSGAGKPSAKAEPFAFADFTWLTGNARTKEPPMDTKFFTPEIRADVDYIYSFNHPSDNTISGSSEVFRANEFQVTQLGVGGDFHFDNVRTRLMTQFGMYSQTTPRNDASPARGQWNLDNAYRYLSEAYGGYHINTLHGINIDAGIFMSYVGLFSYYNFDNWAYQPSYVSSNTPWFFNGLRVQIFPTEKLKIEPWFVNGWQSYGRFNKRPGLGLQVLWRPSGKWSILGNQYALGRDALGVTGRTRFHTDDSIEYKYYDDPGTFVSKGAFSITLDAGCESGGGVSCFGNTKNGPKQSFLGFMIYNRLWFQKDLFAVTLGGGAINNPGRYLVLLPPINGATAATGSPYFTENPGDPYKAYDLSGTFDYMPSQYITFRWEYNHRGANVPYFSGSGGVTPPAGNTGNPSLLVPGFIPDLRKRENRLNAALLVKF